MEEWIHPDDWEMVKTYQLERQSGGRTQAQYDFRMLDREGNSRWLTQSGVRTEWEGREDIHLPGGRDGAAPIGFRLSIAV